MTTGSVICARAFEFSCRILKLCNRLWDRGPSARHIGSQLLKCGTSIGSNAEEAQEGQTKPDFIAKLSVSRKEAREAGYWLRLLCASNIMSRQELEWEIDEARQLLQMIRSAIRTAQASPRRHGDL